MKPLLYLEYKRTLATLGVFGMLAVLAGAGCSSTDGTGTPTSCAGLDAHSQAQATVKAFGEAAGALNNAAAGVEAHWLTICNAINSDLGEDSSKKTAAEACAVLNARVSKALHAGVTVDLTVTANCQADLNVQADCEAKCQLPSCDIRASCESGKLVVGCNGTCDGSCDVQGGSVACMGTCSGACTASAAVACKGQCTGQCSDVKWEGTCDLGCSADFNGSCGGTCTGMCDDKNSSGSCAGRCVGTCSAKASGTCSAKCAGTFTGGCKADCTGSCAADADIACNGRCDGTCTVTRPSATCQGECHGTCSVETSPPTCTGSLSCQGSTDCHASCEASASASAKCSSSATLVVAGDADLYAAINAHLDDLKDAFARTFALEKPAAALAARTSGTFSALGDIGVQGAACVAASLQAAAQASVSINVSVQASASVQGKAST